MTSRVDDGRRGDEATGVIRAVTIVRLAPAQAVAVAGVVGEPAAVVPLGDASAVRMEHLDAAVAVAAAASGLHRDDPAVTVWHENTAEQEAAGLVLTVRGKPVADAAWSTGLREETVDPEVAEALAEPLGALGDVVALRALLRRHGDPLSLLAEAASLLHIDGRGIDLLTADLPAQSVTVEAQGRRGQYARAVRAARLVQQDRPPRRLARFVWLAPGAACAWFLANAATSAASGSGDDLAGYGLLAVLTGGAAAYRWSRRPR